MLTPVPAPPAAAVIERALREFQLPATEEQVLQIQQYMRILLIWNEKVNLTALGEFPGFLEWARSEQIAAKQVILWIGARDLPEIQKIGTWEWREPIAVPHSLRRLLLVGTKRSSQISASR